MEGQEFQHPDGVGADHKQTLEVLALDARSGRILWQKTAWEGTPYDTRHKRGSYASPTPVTDGKLVYAYFGSEGLYVYDFDGPAEVELEERAGSRASASASGPRRCSTRSW